MEEKELKNKMMSLWEKTFHDSREYTSLIFDKYFNPDYVAYTEEKGDIISSLMGIPYNFHNNGKILKGLYLCGLNTKAEFRNRGLMSNLIEDINKRAQDMGFAFTFLIPSNEILVNYYNFHKYYKAIYRIEDRYTDIHNFENDFLSSLQNESEKINDIKYRAFSNSSCFFLDYSDTDIIKEVMSFIHEIENNPHNYITLLHTDEDLKNIIVENDISKGRVVVCRSPQNDISGVAFLTTNDNKRVYVQHIFYNDYSSYFKVLQFIKKSFSEYSLSVYLYPEQTSRKAIEMKVFGGASKIGDQFGGYYGAVERVYNVSAHAKLYGMIRPLAMSEILKFLANDKKDAKFSILIKEKKEVDNKGILANVRNGEAIIQQLDSMQYKEEVKKREITILTEKELYELLFRKPDQTTAIIDAFGIPRMIFNMALLLD